jgi:lipopolysaccharide transport protein LptA
MAASNAKLLVPMALTLCAARAFGAAHAPTQGQTITVEASSFDATETSVVFHRVHISQGTMSITADVGQGQGSNDTSKNFDDGTWLFRGNVKITTDEGDLASDEAQIKFLRQKLTTAVVNGKPASFEKHLVKTGKLAQGHADTIDYDVAKGIVRLTKNGWLTDGSYEIHGDSLKYNMLTQTMNAEGSASGPAAGTAGPSSAPGTDQQDSQRVHITIPPPSTKP